MILVNIKGIINIAVDRVPNLNFDLSSLVVPQSAGRRRDVSWQRALEAQQRHTSTSSLLLPPLQVCSLNFVCLEIKRGKIREREYHHQS